jgi:hypothetical protein
MLVSRFAYSSTLKMEAKCSSETSVNTNGLNEVIPQKIEILAQYELSKKVILHAVQNIIIVLTLQEFLLPVTQFRSEMCC